MGDSYRGAAYRPGGYNDNNPDYYRAPPPDHYGRASPPRRPRDDGGFQFRGAAQPEPTHWAHGDRYLPPPPDFSFRSAGPSAPHFPPAAPSQYNQQANQRRDRRGNDRRGNQRGGRGGGRGRGRGGRSRAAHARDLMSKSTRAATPDQMEGMNDEGKSRYDVDYVSSDEDDDAASTGGDNGDQPSTKRTKTGATMPDASAAPKWSNPDPYTVLPPTDMSMAPKKDIVQTIRKAKVDAANKASSANAIKENVDFISFDDFNDEAEEEPDAELSEDGEIEDTGGVDLGFDITPQFDRAPSVGSPPPPPPPDDSPRDTMPFNGYLRPQEVSTVQKNKRKRGPEPSASSSAAGVINPEWISDGSNPTPWFRNDAEWTSHVGLQLHKELADFFQFVRPYDFEHECRKDLVDRIQRAVRSFGYNSNIDVLSFGSFASGLYLPTADMDLVAVSQNFMRSGSKRFCQHRKEMFALSAHLTRTNTAKKGSMVVIHKAKVPILKFVDAYTDLKVDISFENDSGLRAIDVFLDWKREFPEAPQLVVIVKQLLAMRGLNEVHTGGVGGFTIICLVVSMFQLMPPQQSGNPRGRLGELLLNFLDLYGNRFDRHTTGIRMNPPGYFNKRTDHCPAKINPTGLTIIDPNRPDNDISGGSKQIENVFNCFRGALAMIQHRLDAISNGDSDDQSILGCVLGGNYSSFIQQRDILRDCADRLPQSVPPPPRDPHHTLPPRPPQQQTAFASQPPNYMQQTAFAPQPPNYMQQPQYNHGAPATYNNYPTSAHSNVPSQRNVENGYSGSRYAPQPQAVNHGGPPGPKKGKGKTKKKNAPAQKVHGEYIDLT